MDLKRITLFADDQGDHPSADYAWVDAWLKRWKGHVRIVDYSTGGWEHLWDIEAPPEAAAEIPEHLLCMSEWSDPELRSNPKSDAIEIARDVLEGKIGIAKGSARLSGLAHRIVPRGREDPDFDVFRAVESATFGLPVGSVRQYWSTQALAEVDASLEQIEKDAGARVRCACKNIIERFADAEQAN
jgi:hypothetical protein